MLFFDDSFEEIFNSKALADIATAGRHRGLSAVYIKHYLFHQNKLGREVELQNTRIVLFKSPREVMQVITLSAQLDPGSELVDWCRVATSASYGNLLFDLSPRTGDLLLFCTNTVSIPSKFHVRDRLKQSNFLDDEHTKFLYPPIPPINFPQLQKSFLLVLPKRVYQVPLRLCSKSSQRKLAKHKKTSCNKNSIGNAIVFFYRQTLGSKKYTVWHPKKGYNS